MSISPADVQATNHGTEPISKKLREFFLQCPYLPMWMKSINVDYQGDEAGSFMIESTPSNPWVKKYINGKGVKQFVFAFSSVEIRTPDVLDNIENSGFYEKVSEWLDECTNARALPDLDGNRQPLRIYATTSGYVYDTDNGTAKYMIQCNFEYLQY